MNYNRAEIMAELNEAIAKAERYHNIIEWCSDDILDMVETRGIAADKRVDNLRAELAELDALDEHIREVVREAPDATHS